MEKIMKQTGPSRQLFETINFAFMKIFDFLVKIAIFWAFLLFLGDSCHKLRPKSSSVARWSPQLFSHQARFSAVICEANHPRKSRKAQKMAIFTKKSKFFIKAKLTASKSCLLGPTCSMVFSIFRDAHLQKVKYLKSPSYDFWNFSYAQLHWHSSNSFCWVS